MKNDPIPLETALINLYNSTRKALLTLEEHDLNRAYTDVLAQALNIKLEWSVPNVAQDATPSQSPDAPKQVDLVGLAAKNAKKKY